MVSALLDRPIAVHVPLSSELHVHRADIDFYNVAPGRVRLSVTVSNVGDIGSEPATMTIQAAPLGAFVPWKDVTSLAIPPIPPHGQTEVTTELTAPPPTKALGEFSRVPPRKLLTALASVDDNPPQPNAGQLGQLFLRLLGRGARSEPARDLPGDPLSLLARPSPHWAGNINIHIGRQAVERHLARALRIYPGRTNLAVFIVGDRRDEYQFTLAGSGASWDAALFDCTNLPSFKATSTRSHAIPLRQWIRLEKFRAILLAISPPHVCEQGSVEVHVRQRSTGKDAIVEFSLDANAAGAGCYTV